MKTLEQCEEDLPVSAEVRFPYNGFFAGSELPCRFEAEVYNCVVRGEIPSAIDGTYYRVMPDAPWAPLYGDDVFINGDGCVNAIRIQDGHVDFKSRFVRTEKFCIERAARSSVYGKYRNRYTDDPRVKHAVHSTNTHVIYYENQLLALKEDSRPYAMDPDTLETKGYYDFGGQYSCPTHTAHPKLDLATGELITMGYEAKGDSTTDIAYYLFDKDGKKLEECWLNAPYVGMMHDMAATDKWIVFCLPPLETISVDDLKAGHKHFAWDENKPLMFGILPRRNPTPDQLRWFEFKNAFFGHVGNAFDGEDGCVYLDAPLTYGNKFWFFPPPEGDSKLNTQHYKSHYVRWKLDPNATDRKIEPTILVDLEGEMPRVDDRFVTKPYTTLFIAMTNRSVGRDKAVTGGSYNSVAACDVNTGEYRYWSAGDNVTVHEPAFVPRSNDAPEADGWLITVANRRDIGLSCLFVLDTAKLEDGPVAIIELPFRLRAGIHGSWVPANWLPERKDLCDMSWVTPEMREKFENKPVETPFPSNASLLRKGAASEATHRARDQPEGIYAKERQEAIMEYQEFVFKRDLRDQPIATDVYYSRETSNNVPKPIAILLHGGGFVIGSKGMIPEAHKKTLVELGFIVVVPNYRLAPTISVYDGPVQDAKDAYTWCQTELANVLPKRVPVDGERIVAVGYSAGATLALLLASMEPKPRAMLDFYGPLNFSDPFWHSPLPSLNKLPEFPPEFLAEIFEERDPSSTPSSLERGNTSAPPKINLSRPRNAWLFNAMKYGTHLESVVRDGDYARVDPLTLFSPSYPPTAFVHGDQDSMVDFRFSEYGHEVLKGFGVDTKLIRVESKDHGFDANINEDMPEWALVKEAFDFLVKYI